jgi:hypothetical protein
MVWSFAKRMECAELAPALEPAWTTESGSKLRALHTLREIGLRQASRVAKYLPPLGLCRGYQSASGQNSALPGVRAKGITSRIFGTPVRNISSRSNPRPNPACGTVP